MYINKTKNYLIQLTNNYLKTLSDEKFIRYKTKRLCIDHLIDLLDPFYNKKYNYINDSKKEISIHLNSRILLKKYGRNYKLYIDFLIEQKFIFITKKYVPNKHSIIYTLNLKKHSIDDIVEYKNYDTSKHKRLLKFYNEDFNFLAQKEDLNEVLQTTIENLNYITINQIDAFEILYTIYPDKKSQKFYHNQYCINTIINKQIYAKPDKYGRIHTNFTVLKKEVRNSCLLIDNEKIYERDISNSQPFFLLKLMSSNTFFFNDYKEDLHFYYDKVVSGNFYEEVNKLKPCLKRNEVKKWVMLILFNKNYYHDKEFESLFPSVYKFIRSYKKQHGYKSLAQRLQNIESDFIFKKICPQLIEKGIKYFTIHDSICVKKSDKEPLDKIFDDELKEYYDQVNTQLKINI